MIAAVVDLVKLSFSMFVMVLYTVAFWASAAYFVPVMGPEGGNRDVMIFSAAVCVMGPIYMWGPGLDLIGCKRFVKAMNVVMLVTIGAFAWVAQP